MRLVAQSDGRLCVRYYRKPSGEMLNAIPYRLHQIKRRASRLAAGAFTAALSLSASVSAQTPSSSSSSSDANAPTVVSASPDEVSGIQPLVVKNERTDRPPAVLSGTIKDPNDAMIYGADVTLLNQETNQELKTTTDDEGYYSFPYLLPGKYTLKIESQGFEPYTITNLPITGGEDKPEPLEINATLGARGVVLGGAMAVATPRLALVAEATADKLDAVRQLINAGVDVNAIDEDTDTTALMQAVGNGNVEMVRELLAAGARVNAKSKEGKTALLYLDTDATPELVGELLAAGAKVNQRDEEGNTILIELADAEKEKPDVLQALIDAGAKVNARNKDGETALYSAAGSQNIENVRVLLRAGADPNIKDEAGESALQEARRYGNAEIVQLLLAYGAKE